MKLFGIIGKPLDQSLSPKLYNRLFQRHSLEYRYLPFQVEKQHLKNLVICMKLIDVFGLNITQPYKEAVVSWMDRVEAFAKKCGAVNLIIRRKNQFIGKNTDGPGFLNALRTVCKTDPRKKNVLIVGAGGSARAIAASLSQAGAARIILMNRHPSRAKKAINHLKKNFKKSEWLALSLNKKNCTRFFSNTDILIQTTPAQLSLPLSYLPKQALVCDILYHPLKTKLLKQAKRGGLKTMDGLSMFLFQAALNFQEWTKIKERPARLRLFI